MAISNKKRILLVTVLLVVAWNIAAWVIAQTYFQSRIEGVVQQESGLAQARANDLADSIQRNLAYISGIPKLFTKGPRFRNALARFGRGTLSSSRSVADKARLWGRDPQLRELNQFLTKIPETLNFDLLYVVNAAGDCIAASNADTPGSPVGTNFAERDYFRANLLGQPGMQYALGKTTKIAGLYFSYPMLIDGRFMGAIVAKMDVPTLSFMINSVPALVTDGNGVIILAHDRALEMSALAGAPIEQMSAEKRIAIYRREAFPVLTLTPWGDNRFPTLLRMRGSEAPHVMVSRALPQYGLTVHVDSEISQYAALKREGVGFALLLGLAGSVLILIENGVALYLDYSRRSAAKLKEQQSQLETMMHAAHDGIHVLDMKGRIILVNEAFCRMLGYTSQELQAMQISDWDTGVTQENFQARFATLATGAGDVFETRLRRKSGAEFDVEISAAVVVVEGQKRIYCAARDISERKRIEEELRLASLVLKNSSDGMVVTDADNRIIAVNPAFTSLTGYTFDDVRGKNPRMFKSGRHDAAFYQEMWRELRERGHWQGEVWDKRKNGELHAKWLTINTVRNEQGGVHRYVALFSDITEKKHSEELIWKQANFDMLTGLPNRHMLLDRLLQETHKADRNGLTIALLLIDLDLFKEVNDTLGHIVGDALLQQAALRIAACVRESDTVARLGGDEFTVILSALPESNRAETIAQNIISHLSEPFYLGNEVAYVSASVGITLYPGDGKNIEDLMRNADQAMYVAKQQGRGRFSHYTPSLQEAAQKRLRLTTDLRGALHGQQLRLLFQPIVELPGGRVSKAEALLRWQHPERGTINPQEFIHLAEESGLIHSIGDWVFREAAGVARRWSVKYGMDFQISVNKSPVQFRASGNDYTKSWPEYLQEIGLPGRQVVVEITEGMLLNAETEVVERLLHFRDAGIQVAIDDFGTGYSSLSYLKKFDIDYLKIDQSFVRNLGTDANDRALCEAIIVMAHKLDLKVIAEGVESAQQRDVLTSAGCDFAQGYLFSRPLTAEEFEQLLDGN
ncbi:MAG TPA: EAL domain-containing protein [Gallionellaceae bacterium]